MFSFFVFLNRYFSFLRHCCVFCLPLPVSHCISSILSDFVSSLYHSFLRQFFNFFVFLSRSFFFFRHWCVVIFHCRAPTVFRQFSPTLFALPLVPFLLTSVL